MALSPYDAGKMGGRPERSKGQGGEAFESNHSFSQIYNQFLSGGLNGVKPVVEGRLV